VSFGFITNVHNAGWAVVFLLSAPFFRHIIVFEFFESWSGLTVATEKER